MAGVAGFEPTNAGIKIRCLNHLATPQCVVKKRLGRATRIELTTSRATIWRSNQLSYTRHILVRLKRFELLTHGLEGRCSIQLSYRREFSGYARYESGAGDGNRTHAASLEGWNSTIELHPHFITLLRRIDNACI